MEMERVDGEISLTVEAGNEDGEIMVRQGLLLGLALEMERDNSDGKTRLTVVAGYGDGER